MLEIEISSSFRDAELAIRIILSEPTAAKRRRTLIATSFYAPLLHRHALERVKDDDQVMQVLQMCFESKNLLSLENVQRILGIADMDLVRFGRYLENCSLGLLKIGRATETVRLMTRSFQNYLLDNQIEVFGVTKSNSSRKRSRQESFDRDPYSPDPYESDYYDSAPKYRRPTGDSSKLPQHHPDYGLEDSLLNCIVEQSPGVNWNSIAGLQSAKEAIQEATVLPLQFPELFVGSRRPWSSILLYGPPGTGKTMLAKAVATEIKRTFFSISASNMASKWYGETERFVLCPVALLRLRLTCW